jgi:hypothetical protein
VLVKDIHGHPVPNAKITVVDFETKTALPNEEYAVDAEGAKRLVVRTAPDVELVVTAPGKAPKTQIVYWASQYEFKLHDPGQVLPSEPISTPTSTTVTVVAVQPAPAVRKTRTVSVVVEGEEGPRLKDAEVAVLESKTKKILERKLLVEGLGAVEVAEDAGTPLELIATVPGRDSTTQAVGGESSYVFKLKRRQTTNKLSVAVKDSLGRAVAEATVVATEGGRKLASVATDNQGLAELNFAFSDPSDLALEVHHGGYRPKTTPVRPSQDTKLEVVLMPARPAIKSSLVTVLVLSKAFAANPKHFEALRAAVTRVLQDCAGNPDVWRDVALLGLGDGRVREILPLTKNLGEAEVKEAKTRLSGLAGDAGTLSWRDLEKLAQFLGNSSAIGDAGADVLVLAPRNVALDEKLSLYDAGGDGVMDGFRQKNLRLRLIEIGATDDGTKAYKELCEKTQGIYKAVKMGEKLGEEIAKLQFHFPTPPPTAEGSPK